MLVKGTNGVNRPQWVNSTYLRVISQEDLLIERCNVSGEYMQPVTFPADLVRMDIHRWHVFISTSNTGVLEWKGRTNLRISMEKERKGRTNLRILMEQERKGSTNLKNPMEHGKKVYILQALFNPLMPEQKGRHFCRQHF